MSVHKSFVALRVTKRRQEARLGTGMRIVEEFSPQIEVMGKSQDQLPETPLARTHFAALYINVTAAPQSLITLKRFLFIQGIEFLLH
jgi:hypothetical protein